MNDTHPDIQAKMDDMMKEKTPEERMMMGFSMFDFAKKMVIASLQENGPLPEKVLKQKLFLRFYGDDFDEEEKAKILEWIGKS